MPDERISLFLMTGATIVLWGVWGFFGKLALNKGMPPLAIFCVEIFASLICAGLVMAATRLAPGRLGGGRTNAWNIYGVISGCGLALGLLFYYLALYRSQAAIVVPLTAAYPIVTTLLSTWVLRERLSPSQWVGIVLVVAGVVLLLQGPAKADDGGAGPADRVTAGMMDAPGGEN